MNTGWIRTLTFTLATLIAAAGTTAAQIRTGTITGSVKDALGGGIPGAAAVLVSDTRGTRLAEAVTSLQGNFVFANVPPDRYTLQVTMQGFKTFKRSDVSVSPGDRASVGTITLEVGGSGIVRIRRLPIAEPRTTPVAPAGSSSAGSAAPRRAQVRRSRTGENGENEQESILGREKYKLSFPFSPLSSFLRF